MEYPTPLRFKLLGLSLATLLTSHLAQATCVAPPPSLNLYPNNLANDEHKLGFMPQLTTAGSDYSCPHPYLKPDGTWGYEMRVAYRTATVLNKSIVHSLSDSDMQAIGLGNLPASTAPQWSSDTIYQQGNKVQWQGSEYTAQWWTQGEVPGSSAQGAWLKASNAELSAWDASQIYQANAKAIYDNKVWQARWWNQNEIPGSNEWGAWQVTNDALPAAGMGRFSAALELEAQGADWFLKINVMPAKPNLAAPSYIEVRKNGLAIGRLTEFSVSAVQCQTADSNCLPGMYWSATGSLKDSTPFTLTYNGSLSNGVGAFYSVWACTADSQCRPTKLTAFANLSSMYGHNGYMTSTIHPTEPFPLRD
ncbi:carbohydrate-binding protein [Chitinibacter sp. GC72]|uniref:carbohydrate-binding protein n=1 Tax=Chitinibacter sp. GC72 TaxID=1526917 RepID=UPI0012FCAC90|nr:carbohydrate-binding protein [Chitinibacter sp. GC72]